MGQGVTFTERGRRRKQCGPRQQEGKSCRANCYMSLHTHSSFFHSLLFLSDHKSKGARRQCHHAGMSHRSAESISSARERH